MTDSIVEAREIAGCENNNTQDFIHAQWRGLNAPTVKLRYPEFEPYVDCLINYLSRNFNSQSEVIAAGGVNNVDAKRVCLPTFQQTRKKYCTKQVTDRASPVEPLSSELSEAELENNIALIEARSKAKAQKILTDKQEEIIAKQNKIIEDFKTSLSNIASVGLSDNPILAAVIQPKIQDILDKITENARQFAKERTEASKNLLKNNVEAFSYPMKPLPPQQPSTLSVEPPRPTPPTIQPLPTV